LKVRGSILRKRRYFSLLRSVQTGSEDHPTSYPVGTGAISQGVKRPGYETDHSPPPNAEVKKMMRGGSTSTLSYIIIV
jgi:hypothetical protein